MKKRYVSLFPIGLFLLAGSFCPRTATAQQSRNFAEWDQLVNTPAVSGYEQPLASLLNNWLKDFSPRTDNMGNVYVTLGSGTPHRLIVTSIDEPGYVVSEITPDGFLRVQRLPQQPPTPVFDLLHAAQPAWVIARSGKRIPGVFAGLSVHLQPLRPNPPKMTHPEDIFVDIGAASAEEVRSAGVDVLDPVVLARSVQQLGSGELAGPAIGDRIGSRALVGLLGMLRASKPRLHGTLTVAFVTQQWTGGRGLDRLLNQMRFDEMVYVGRLSAPRKTAVPTSVSTEKNVSPGSGVLLGVADASAALSGLSADLKKLADSQHLAVTVQVAAPPRIASYAAPTPFPQRSAQLGVPTLFPVTPAETISNADTSELQNLLYLYASGETPHAVSGSAALWQGDGTLSPIVLLTETYGASGHEDRVREKIKSLLPSWAKPETDAAGNLILHLGNAKAGSKSPKIVFIAHMDEIGYQARSIEPDGRLLVDVLGGGFTEYFLGHVVLVHTADQRLGGVLELPAGWDQPGYEWPHGPQSMDESVHVYVGTHSADDTRKLGIKPGDWVTIPKQYRPLLGTRANARSFDDRVGCAALIEALKSLGADLPGRDVTFLWSTEEEVGLKGAAAAAERLAKENQTPDFVFAIDTFVSSDSPLESKRFAHAEIGKGSVLRAVDNSNITPREYVDRVVKLAREHQIPVQYGVTGGGNDGAVFSRYGSVDIPLGWPLRYSHSPAEVIDTRDLDALAKIITILAKSW